MDNGLAVSGQTDPQLYGTSTPYSMTGFTVLQLLSILTMSLCTLSCTFTQVIVKVVVSAGCYFVKFKNL